jgi:hypothetical protein
MPLDHFGRHPQVLPDEGTTGRRGAINGNIKSLSLRGRGYNNLRDLLLKASAWRPPRPNSWSFESTLKCDLVEFLLIAGFRRLDEMFREL